MPTDLPPPCTPQSWNQETGFIRSRYPNLTRLHNVATVTLPRCRLLHTASPTCLQDQLWTRDRVTVHQPIETRANNFSRSNTCIRTHILPNLSAYLGNQQLHNKFDTRLATNRFATKHHFNQTCIQNGYSCIGLQSVARSTVCTMHAVS